MRNTQPFGTGEAVGFGVNADKRGHFQYAGRADDFDHQIGADISGAKNGAFYFHKVSRNGVLSDQAGARSLAFHLILHHKKEAVARP